MDLKNENPIRLKDIVIKRYACPEFECFRMKCVRCGHVFDQAIWRPKPATTEIRLECQVCADKAEGYQYAFEVPRDVVEDKNVSV